MKRSGDDKTLHVEEELNKKTKLSNEVEIEIREPTETGNLASSSVCCETSFQIAKKKRDEEIVASIVSQLQRMFRFKYPSITLKNAQHRKEKIEATLKKLDLNFAWRKSEEKPHWKLFVENIFISQGNTQEIASHVLIPYAPLKNYQFPIESASDHVIIGLLPTLQLFTKTNGETGTEDDFTSLIDNICSVKQTIESNCEYQFSHSITLGGYLFSDVRSNNQDDAQTLAELQFMKKVNVLVDKSKGKWRTDRTNWCSELFTSELILPKSEFILLEMSGFKSGSYDFLQLMADLNETSLEINYSNGISSLLLGTDFITSFGSKCFDRVATKALNKLKKRCYSLRVRRELPDIVCSSDDGLVRQLKDFLSAPLSIQRLVILSPYSEHDIIEQKVAKIDGLQSLRSHSKCSVIISKKLQLQKLFRFLTRANSSKDYTIIPPYQSY
uniref:Uncharacterized protein n=1 Tax=Strigamia maritima TaxID=126957 RepID=T1IKW0_STRMM